MKVFISWSGELSQKIAEILYDWLPSVIQAVEPFLSSEGTDKGSRWLNELSKELQDGNFGLICLTPDNLEAPWILFEAGALSKALDNSRVCPFLIQLSPSDLKGPLAQFQATMPEKEDMRKLVKSINTALSDKALPENKLDKAFDQWWETFDESLCKAMAQIPGPPDSSPKRPQEDILEEVLMLCRSMAQAPAWAYSGEAVPRLYYAAGSTNPSFYCTSAKAEFPPELLKRPNTMIPGGSALNPMNAGNVKVEPAKED